MFTDEFAEQMKIHTGEKFRPSNGTEGDLFMFAHCWQCAHENNCEIIGKTMLYAVEDEEYPAQWQYGDDGQPTCTEFESAVIKKINGECGVSRFLDTLSQYEPLTDDEIRRILDQYVLSIGEEFDNAQEQHLLGGYRAIESAVIKKIKGE
jgi:hypothetical protein